MTAAELIAALDLAPHPEGGWFRETWRADPPAGTPSPARAAGTLIHFLLESTQSSHWHRVDAHEVWCWQGGDRLDLEIAADDAGPVRTATLGPDPLAGDQLQAIVPPGHWQAARPCAGSHGYALVSCAVMPGFVFAGFELAPPEWSPGQPLRVNDAGAACHSG
ncbi:cupin domain-containing protein [Novosphingobium sp.]|uniref:cupin domain-containing protein n=1 Tax=Novosphingobium sp. TaxID=1874826 RepID=UPI00333EE4E9